MIFAFECMLDLLVSCDACFNSLSETKSKNQIELACLPSLKYMNSFKHVFSLLLFFSSDFIGGDFSN
jgi:hypothetical protein